MQGCGVVDEQSGVGTMTCSLASHPTSPSQTCCLCFQLCQAVSANRRFRGLIQPSNTLCRVGCGGSWSSIKAASARLVWMGMPCTAWRVRTPGMEAHAPFTTAESSLIVM